MQRVNFTTAAESNLFYFQHVIKIYYYSTVKCNMYRD